MTTRKRLTQRSDFGGRQKKADPYTMHQDRINPPVEKYMNGDPSAWAEGQHPIPPAGTPRNSIGLPEFLDTTWDHKDADVWNDDSAYDNADTFDASDDQSRRLSATRHNRRNAALQIKADHCIRMAEYIFPSSSDRTIEAQALDFMSLPERAIRATLARLAEECGEDDKEASEDEDDKEASVRLARRNRRAEEDEEDEKESKKSRKSKKSDDDEDDEEVESKKSRKSKKADDDEEEEEVESKKSRKSKKSEDEDEDDVEASEDEEDEKESKKSRKSKKAEDDEDEEVESKKSRKSKKSEDEEEEVESKKSRKSKKASKARSLIAQLRALVSEDGEDEDGEVEAMLSEMGFGVEAESDEDEDKTAEDMDMDMMDEEASLDDLDAEMSAMMGEDLDYDANLDGMDLDLDAMELDDLVITPEVDPFPDMMGDDDLVLAQLQGRTASRKPAKTTAPAKQAPKKEGVRSLGRVTTAAAGNAKENSLLENLWKTDPDVSKVFGR